MVHADWVIDVRHAAGALSRSRLSIAAGVNLQWKGKILRSQIRARLHVSHCLHVRCLHLWRFEAGVLSRTHSWCYRLLRSSLLYNCNDTKKIRIFNLLSWKIWSLGFSSILSLTFVVSRSDPCHGNSLAALQTSLPPCANL